MRLISLKIENFGNLSDYSLVFDPALTVIYEENGFGKTTLAEFIRAMFYGFERAGRSLDKNSRKKNLPWQGGTYGGNLVFEYEGTMYRIERTFGSVPRQDSFRLYNVDKNKRSNRFSENIGLELFELDADSFERSTYLPQTRIIDSLSSSGIQAKLGDLVQDTNDINNFDKALQALRNKRSSLIAFRGSSGSVGEAQKKITYLHQRLEEAQSLFPELDVLQKEMDALENRKEEILSALTSTREEITLSAEAASRRTLEAQCQALRSRVEKLNEQQKMILEAYPFAMPSESEMDELLAMYDKAAQLGDAPQMTEAEQEEEAFVGENKERFEQGIPDEETFEYFQNLLNRRISLVSSLEHADLSDNEKKKLEELNAFYSGGIPQEEVIDTWEAKEDELKIHKNRLSDLALAPEEEIQLQHLKIFFAPGIPERDDLSQKQRKLEQAKELRLQNLKIAAAVEESFEEQAAPANDKKAALSIALFIIGLIFLGAGVFFFVRQNFLFGGGFLASGLALLILAAYLRLAQMVSRGGHRSISSGDRQIIRKSEEEAAALEKDVLHFVAPYISDERSLSSKLSEIETKYNQYMYLNKKEKQLEEQGRLLENNIKELTNVLQAELSRFPLDKNLSFHDMLVEIHTGFSQMSELNKKVKELEETAEKTRADIAVVDEEVSAFLQPYYELVEPKDFAVQLSLFRKESADYLRAKDNIERRKKQKEKREEILSQYRQKLHIFSETYSCSLSLEDRQEALRMRDEVKESAILKKNMQEAKQELEEFSKKHEKELAAPISDVHVRGLDELKKEEERFVTELSQINETLVHHHQRLRVIQEQTDTISSLQDDLSEWSEKRQEDIKKAELLDQTIHYLQESKDALSRSYLGSIYQSFTKYMKRLMGEEEENIFIDQDLDVQMERRGAARDLAYFSAGQTDIVMICMRFALVDALFGDKKPFVILDDPFINFDDDNTKRALRLLKELSKEHQIIYMTCNSSREPLLDN